MDDTPESGTAAFGFSGSWRAYAPIAFTNLLLTIVTLGIYTFWARARTRRYLWSQTRFLDDRLEWTGTGLELFIGYLVAMVVFIVPFGVLNLILQGVLLRGHQGAAVLIGVVLYLALIYLVGVAIFRALRYRLSRTLWHGIRGGSDDQGFRYGVSYFWRTLVGTLAIGLMVPWSMTTLWNKRWNAMSFGSERFAADAKWGPIFPRFLLFYLTPVILFIIAIVGVAAIGGGFAASGFSPDSLASGQPPASGIILAVVLGAFVLYAVFFGVLGLVAMIYYSAFFREAAGATTLGGLRFSFNALTMDWIKLYLGNLGLVLVTFGIGYIFVPYRNWAFFVRHMEATGELATDQFTQSTTREPGQGEGLLDAFDVGAF